MGSTIDTARLGLRCGAETNRIAVLRSLLRAASGERSVRASDDPDGLAIAGGLSSALAAVDGEFRRLDRSAAVARTADGALGAVSSLLAEARGLSVALADGMRTPEARAAAQAALDAAIAGIDRIGATTTFGGRRLFDGSAVVATGSATLLLDAIGSRSLGAVEDAGAIRTLADVVAGGAAAPGTGGSATAPAIVARAADEVAERRGELGAFLVGAVETRMRALAVAYRTMAGALSPIADADLAAESAARARAHLLDAASIAVPALAGSDARNVLGLIGRD